MIHYVTLGSNDLPRAKRFYDAALGTLGLACHADHADEIGYGPATKPAAGRANFLWIVKPFLAYAATWGNGTMLCLTAATRQEVRDFHAVALANGGSDDGAPGLRPWNENFYACYVRDPDGNKLSAVCEAAE